MSRTSPELEVSTEILLSPAYQYGEWHTLVIDSFQLGGVSRETSLLS